MLCNYTVSTGKKACSFTNERYIAHGVKLFNYFLLLLYSDLINVQYQKTRLVFKPQSSLSHNSVTTICKQMVYNCCYYSGCLIHHIALHYILHHALPVQTNRKVNVSKLLA